MVLFIFAALFSIGNKDFFDTSTEQQKAGYSWHQLEQCRQVAEGLPAITLDTVNGSKVCYKLALTAEEAK